MKIPKKIDVGPFTYKVKVVPQKHKKLRKGAEKGTFVYGAHYPGELVIYLCEGQSKQMLRDTLLHELLHAVFGVVGGWPTGIEEEKVVSMFTTMTLDTLGKRNKKLAKVLFQ